MKRTLAVFLAVLMLLCQLPVGAFAANEVTLSSGGSLNTALEEVEEGGTIRVIGTVSVTSALSAHGKTVTVTGGTLDFSSLSTVTLGDHITFDHITLTFASGATVYAAGYKVTIGAGVTLTNPITIYGGKNGGTVASTDLTLLAGTYTNIYGGSRSGTVTGDTHLTVGGTVNADIDETNHSGENRIHGGNYGGNIGGTAYTVFTGNAKARYIYGGCRDTGIITGGTNVVVSGGSLMHVNGGGRGDYTGDVKMVVSGGTMEQVFGGCNGGAMTGNVQLDITGGTITRRVYGGCYNEASRSGLSVVWGSSNYVTGNIVLTLHSGANITFTYDTGSLTGDDLAVFAHSRQKTLSSTEVTQLVYADATAYSKYENNVGAQDTGAVVIMGYNTAAADSIHYRTYAASGTTITQSCICGGCAATATLSATKAGYTGKAIQTAKVTYSGTWYGADPVISYSNNVNAGTATASMTAGGATASTTFTITNASQTAPTLGKTDETVKGKKDGSITGLTTAMEYSADGTAFTPVTDTAITFAPGTWYVRYAAKTNYDASPATTVVIGEGKPLKVTFLADGQQVAVREVEWNGTLTDIPAVPAKTGHDQTAPSWDVTDLTAIQTDLTVHAVYTPNRYTVTFRNDDGAVISTKEYNYGETVEEPAAPTKAADKTYTYAFDGWDKEVVACEGNAIYTATYTATYIDYTVTFEDDDGTVLSQKTYHYGDAVAAPAVPTKAADRTYTYAFNGWDKEVVACEGNAIYTATYKATYIEYTVKFLNADGTVLSEKTCHYGDEVEVPTEPARPDSVDPTFIFRGWDKEVTACEGNAVYTALFASPVKPGDINGDDVVDNADVVYLLWHSLFGGESYPVAAKADVNGDGAVTNGDVLYLLWHTIFGAEEYPLN